MTEQNASKNEVRALAEECGLHTWPGHMDLWFDNLCAFAEKLRVRHEPGPAFAILKGIVRHWNEFGPDHGLGEIMQYADQFLDGKGPVYESTAQPPEPAPTIDYAKFIDILPVTIQDEPNAHRLQMKVGVQSFSIGPDYLEDREHAEWFVQMIVKAFQNMHSSPTKEASRT